MRSIEIKIPTADGMREVRIDRLVISAILNHTESGVTKVYERFADEKGKREALELWGQKLRRIVEPKAGKVVNLRSGAENTVNA